MKKLFLDDVRIPEDCISYMSSKKIYKESDWDIVRNYSEFVEYIDRNGVPNVVSFDHDLADEHYDPSMYVSVEDYKKTSKNFDEKTGYDCAKWLCNYCIENGVPLPTFHVHSMNPVGRENIEKYLENCNRYAS